MDDDPFDDAAFTAAALALESTTSTSSAPARAPTPRSAQPTPATLPRITQPTPQALPTRHAPTSILVSPRQKGNPILKSLTALPWEYADIPADYTLGQTTCCLFLSLKYHRLHPEYIYSRIKGLAKNYNLRVLLAMVDIDNHEESLKELAKTSLVNNLTLILCWSAREAARYLELYKQYEFAGPGAIRKMEGTGYADRMVDFITTVRSVNKTDAVALVSAFGSVRAAVNARPEEVAAVSGWGEKKVARWCGTMQQGFRVPRAERRGVEGGVTDAGDAGEGSGKAAVGREAGVAREDSLFEDPHDALETARATVEPPVPTGKLPARAMPPPDRVRATGMPEADKRPPKRGAEESRGWEPGDDEEEAFSLAAEVEEVSGPSARPRPAKGAAEKGGAGKKARPPEAGMSEGVAAALAKLREG